MIRISIAGVLGYEAAYRLLKEHRKELEKRFAGFFIRRVEGLAFLNIPEQEILQPAGSEAAYVYPIGEGGLFAALWNACEELSHGDYPWAAGYTGCEVDLEAVPVRQEVTEICELYQENPYEVSSAGAWLIIWKEDNTEETEEKEEKRKKSGLCIQEQSVIIGKLTKNCRRTVQLNGRVRFLTPPDRQSKDIDNRKSEV